MIERCKNKFDRLGIRNARYYTHLDDLDKYRQKIDTVILDMPSTGSGILRKNPELKLKFSLESLDKLGKTLLYLINLIIFR